ncbi:hypothetical protein [uncultured Microscilla sp.]|uniref:hypothetical protein n=1 Tax=uncultured Microscilla sp. TaxID=432653 RepID=UPI00260B8A9D|nr:hypothetical protein [uncultured Microscilla sp.]
MKKHFTILSLLLILSLTPFAHSQGKINSTKRLLKAMKKRYDGKWFKAFTFIQKTIRYNAQGQPSTPAIWYEAIRYPNQFRIDIGDLKNGKSVIFDADSAYSFKQGKLTNTRYDPQHFLLMKGGLYYYSLKKCLRILTKGGYNTDLFHANTYNGRPVYVIGAKKGDLKTPQFWLDQTHFYVVRRIRATRSAKVLDVQYTKHQATGGGWVEQKVSFELNGRLVQVEEYTNIDTSPKLPKGFFDPTQFGKSHWYKEQ